MEKEQYVSLETSQLLKEKGFDWDTDKVYERNLMACRYEDYPMPTQATACRWLREEKGIHICGEIYKDYSEDADGNIVDEWTYWGWSFYWLPSGNIGLSSGSDEFASYEEAVEAALQYCLKNIVK